MSFKTLHPWEQLGATHFHGTGYLSHNFGSNKYQGTIDGIKETLAAILKEGLNAFPDPLNHGFAKTVSVTEDPRYAVLYSLLYCEKGGSKRFGVNRGREWFRILWEIFTKANAFSIKKYRTGDGRLVGLKEFRMWTNSFNQTDYKHFLGGFRGMIWGESDIKGNFPVLIGVKELDIHAQYMPGWNERRVPGGISRDYIVAIFVPKERMGDVPETEIPIFPLEDFIQKYF